MNIKQKIPLSIIAIISILFVLVFFLFKPLLTQIQKLSQAVGYERAILKSPALQEQYKSRLAEIEKDYQAIEPKLSILKQSVLESKEAVKFIEILENTSRQMGITQEIRIKSEADRQTDNLIFNLFLTGNFPAFLRFLEIIENNQYLLQVQKMQIKALRDKEKQLTGQIQSNVEIKIYIH